jgi:NAD(P)-dependent dehydrogenase (short-subunit alcohol dehydrogenase family)
MASSGELRGKVAIITGGSRGIGRAMALAFAAAGAQVVVASRTENEPPPDSPFLKYGSGTINATVRQIGEAGGEALPVACDVTKSEDLLRLADRTVKHFGRIDIVVSPVWTASPRW